ncbi:MAG: alkaline phosphatase family protein [Cutibacterium granulosum]|uniref:alkaline phosphatase family protein n=1 Tax=Cutibacterium granulosum TaxID=33011 RepID=UPI0023F895A5|nr:alkaline phosphatase family protein [Cutibacterium granulosum]MDU3822081.1 alkaline phosphatase family protein [Cutibacterium granulosum]MEA5634792.1 alkaline phosphatase family protein [Cutibacterium granulosum]MEA5637533.1 alkaline phosphatase family protein [Cutibacterium granulosum]MEA5642448.1 alkaline phosphatase family protein [Cutibacterium granulosum]MEA5648808.1 alkaline phosphatase family protein [Cutibacterium granulosum]
MKLLLVCIDGLRLDMALPEVLQHDPGFAQPDHPADPRFVRGVGEGQPVPEHPAPALDHTLPTDRAPHDLAPTLARLVAGDERSEGTIIPMWMTPPTDSAPGWTTILTGATHEQCNVWWNEFVGHDLARHPDILSRVFFANPSARTLAAATWDAFVSPYGPGPIIQQRVDQQRTGQHKLFGPDLGAGIDRADEQVSSWAAWHLLHEGPDAAVVYFEGVDHAGHSSGAESTQYQQAIGHVDELTRHLVKAVAERHEQLGEQWLVAVTTDHGHKPEGGHGEDEVEVRRSFLAAHHIGGALPESLRRTAPIRSHEVTGLLLSAIGAHSGHMDSADVGVLRDIEPIGPTRKAGFEW